MFPEIAEKTAELYFKDGNTDIARKQVPAVALIPIVIFVILIVGIGIYPKFITGLLNSAAAELLNRVDYIRNVLG